MVSIMVLPRKDRSGSVALRVITRERVFLVYVDVLIMTFEITRATKNGLLSLTAPRVLAGVFPFSCVP
jgi:hypothetical protein